MSTDNDPPYNGFATEEDVAEWRRDDFGFDTRYGDHAVTAAVRSTRGDKIVEKVVGLIECPRCGAWISDVDLHIRWHERLAGVS